MPDWLTTIDRAEAYWTAETSHVLGDANNVFVAVRLPTGHNLTAIVLVDHNLGTITKDGFVVPGSGPVIIPRIHTKHDVADVTLTEIAPADARARIADAIESDARTYPPTETETWPQARPLVEWMISLLPDGGTGYEPREWTEDERTRLVERFLASPFAAPDRSRPRRSRRHDRLVRMRLRRLRPAAVEPSAGRDPPRGLDPSQDRCPARLPREGAGRAAASFGSLTPSRASRTV